MFEKIEIIKKVLPRLADLVAKGYISIKEAKEILDKEFAKY